MSKKKVLVSGCFDLLHSGHIEFFRQASEYGELYVRLGSDENISKLKHHRPMYSNLERLYCVNSIKYVHNAEISSGTGEFDFVEDFKIVQPDIYFVNEDASNLDKRKEFCDKLGIQIIIAPRTPATSLEARSSTDLKKRLRQYQEEEKLDRLKEGVEAFHTIIPWRLCFVGGWMDLPFANDLYPGCVITINIKFHPEICRDQCGLATSSRKHAIQLWNGELPTKNLSANQAAQYLWGAENVDHFGTDEKHYVAGSQDHCGLFFPGINKLCYDHGYWPKQFVHLNDIHDEKQMQIFSWLESILYIVDIPFVSRPSDYNSQRINYLTDDKIKREEKVGMVEALAKASEAAWRGICEMDSKVLGKALSDTMVAWERMLPYTVDPYRSSEGYTGDPLKSEQLAQFWKKYDIPHTRGCLFSGAGGGFLMVISDQPIPNSQKIKINHDHFCKQFSSDKVDSSPHEFRN